MHYIPSSALFPRFSFSLLFYSFPQVPRLLLFFLFYSIPRVLLFSPHLFFSPDAKVFSIHPPLLYSPEVLLFSPLLLFSPFTEVFSIPPPLLYSSGSPFLSSSTLFSRSRSFFIPPPLLYSPGSPFLSSSTLFSRLRFCSYPFSSTPKVFIFFSFIKFSGSLCYFCLSSYYFLQVSWLHRSILVYSIIRSLSCFISPMSLVPSSSILIFSWYRQN